MRVFIYSRKSVYTGKGESIENQVELCRRYVASRIEGGTDAEIFLYEDEGFSGKNLERPQFQKLLADAKKHKPDYIVCYRLDRISRSVGDFAPLVEDFIARGIGFVCIKEQFDTTTPMGKAMMYIASVFAQLERETIAERVRDNMLLLARTGRWLGGPPPTGYASEKVEEFVVDGRAKTAFMLVPNAAEIGTVRLMYESYLELRSLSGVCRRLLQAGVRNRSGAPYSLPGVKDILRNPVYCAADMAARTYFLACGSDVCFSPQEATGECGLLSYNKRGASQKGQSRLNPSRWIISIGRHKGLVAGESWVRVQRLLEERAEQNPHRPPQSGNGYSLLSGRLFCAHCGARMFAKRRSNSAQLFDYICKSRLRAGGPCACPNLNGTAADAQVCAVLMDCAKNDTTPCKQLEALEEKIRRQAPDAPKKHWDALVQQTERELDGLVAALANAAGSVAVIQRVGARMEQLEAELGRLKASQEQKEQRVASGMDEARLAALSSTLASFPECFRLMSIHEKRDFLRLCVARIEWDGKDLHVSLYHG